MIRLIVYLLILAGIAFGVAWIADRPGALTVDWQGWHLETSVLVAFSALLVLVAVAILGWSVLRLVLRSPDLLTGSLRNRRANRGWAAISRGLIAVGTGDVSGARRAASDAERLIGREPLTQLLAAQAAQLAGDTAGAERAFQAMTQTASTRLLGLRGLHVEARRRGDADAAQAAAEEAAELEPGLIWAADAVIESRCLTGDFDGALAMLEREAAHGGLDRAAHRRRRAVLLAAQAQAQELTDPATAREKAVEAAKLAPTLVPAAEIAGRLLGAAGDSRKAAKILEAAFATTPHPDLAETYLHLRTGDSVRERLKRMRALTARMPSHPESVMALASAAIDAQDFATARSVLAPLLDAPTQRICLLMAELEAAEHNDVGKAREWTARAVRAPRDPAWVADGFVAERWGPISPITGKLDAFVWKVPPGVAASPVLEHEAERVRAAIQAAIEAQLPAPAVVAAAPVEEPAVIEAVAVAPEPVDPVPVAPTLPPAVRAAPSDVIAMPNLPDDPGPEAASFLEESEPKAGATSRPPFGV
ncbi:heme biosynthesis protein HemY [Ancylobacter sp. A5.8]|uniref:heme biosynthesis protein HemY n=1 Tax=Ancylobacter gelatini TaxID=2919920 RepID=UPI001F4ECF01|nr:heme biosynthesis protein HemY [Ancylobacter gelatini]